MGSARPRPSPAPRAPAAAAARAPRRSRAAIDLFDGLVTAERRPPHRDRDRRRDAVHAGRVAGLKLEGRRDRRRPQRPRRTCSPTAARVVVNRGTRRAPLTLGAARGGCPAGTQVASRSPTPAPPTRSSPPPRRRRRPPRPPRPSRKAKKAKRTQGAAKVRERLTGQRYAFPVYGKADVADDFGAARADTGAHEGNDVFAQFGAPVLAVADGTVHRVGTLPISGNRLWLHTDGRRRLLLRPPLRVLPRRRERPPGQGRHRARLHRQHRRRRADPAARALRDPPRRRGRTRSTRMRSCWHGRSTATCPPAPGWRATAPTPPSARAPSSRSATSSPR